VVKLKSVPPELFDSVKGVELAERGAPGGTLLGLGLVVEPERPLPLQLVRHFRRHRLLLCRCHRHLRVRRHRYLARHSFASFFFLASPSLQNPSLYCTRPVCVSLFGAVGLLFFGLLWSVFLDVGLTGCAPNKYEWPIVMLCVGLCPSFI